MIEIERLYLAQMKNDYIARKLGLHISAVQKVLRLIARFGRRFNPRETKKEDY
jgi:hypothetical protein